jgi:hypothetical protein
MENEQYLQRKLFLNWRDLVLKIMLKECVSTTCIIIGSLKHSVGLLVVRFNAGGLFL